MRKSANTVTVKTQVTIRKDAWERLVRYMGDPPFKIVREALRRFSQEIKAKEQAQIRASIGQPNRLN